MKNKRPQRQLRGQFLRVRLTEKEAEALNDSINSKSEFGTVSAMIRSLIREATMDGTTNRTCAVSTETYQKIEAIAKELGRTPSQIITECVEGAIDQIEHGRMPLIAAEVKLRREYVQQQKIRRN